MAFVRTNLERTAGGRFQRFAYQTPDTAATVTASGYFNNASAELRQFDVIECVCSTGGTPTVDVVFVTSATGAATVTTSATEGITAS